MPAFIPGLELSEGFYHDLVAPILREHAADLRYAAGLLGSGSDVLGFDNEVSTDHHWGPRLLLLVAQADLSRKNQIACILSEHLPHEYRGYPTSFGPPDEIGVRLLQPRSEGPVQHMVEITGLADYVRDYAGLDLGRPLDVVDWLATPEQRLLTLTAGQVFHDDTGDLTRLRATLAYYPDEVWRFLLAAQWHRVSQEEAFVGRTGDVGDELGSRVIAARLVRELMKLCFLMERRYAPYAKWFGTAFVRLAAAPRLAPLFAAVLAAPDWKTRETHLSAAYVALAAMHNALGVTEPLPEQVGAYYSRPYLVLNAGHYVDALRATIADPLLRGMPEPIGAVDQFVDSVDVLTRPRLFGRLRAMYEG